MDTKLKSTISKIRQERARGNHARAVKRAAAALDKYPESPDLYREAIDASLEAAESLQAIQFIKGALAHVPGERSDLINLARERASALGDAVVGKFLLEEAVRRRELREARSIVGEFADRTARDLLQRTHMKRATLASAAHGGHSVSDETMTNTISEAILSARLGRPDDAATAAAHALDDNPDDAEALATLLEDMVEEHPGCARASFVLSRCLSSISRHTEATQRLTNAVRLDPELGTDALDLLRIAGDGLDEVPESIERALLETLLITGRFDRAAEVARPWLDRDENGAGLVVDSIAAHTGDGGSITDLHVLLLDAATRADRMARVHETLESLAAHTDNRAPLLEWFDANDDRVFPADIELLRAQWLIDDQRHEDAARALKALCVASQADIPRVSALLAPHRGDHQTLAELADEIEAPRESNDAPDLDIAAPTATTTAQRAEPSGGDGIEVFENQEFRFSAGDGDANPAFDLEDGPSIVDVGERAPADGFNIYDGSDILGSGKSGPRPTAPKRSSYTGERRPLDKDTPAILWEEEGDDAAGDAADQPEIDEEFVRNVADGLYTSGAATFFHIENETGDDADQAADEPPPSEEPPSYEERFSRFLDGHLDDAGIVELMEEAAMKGRGEELGRLIDFSPTTEAHVLRRGLCGAEYELMEGRPARALGYLKSIRNIDMTEEQRKDTWLKTVACQRRMQDLDAARRTVLQLVTLYPDCPEVARLAQQTYSDYLQDQCADAPVLEKVTSLDGDI